MEHHEQALNENLQAGCYQKLVKGASEATPVRPYSLTARSSTVLIGPFIHSFAPSTRSPFIGKEVTDPRVLTDVGDVPVQEIRDCGVDDERLMKVVSESVKLVMEEDPLRPLVLGGDHSISYPVIRAVSEKLGGQVDILHLDAHPDNYNAYEGNYFSHASSFARIMEGGYARRLLQVGIRSISQEGREQCKRFGVELYEMRTFSRDREYLENLKLGEGVKGVYVSIDLDSLDPAFAPGVSHIEPGGLSFRDVLNIIHNLKGDIVGADVVEFNPQRDTVDGMTAMVAAKLVRELTAKIAK
ncbi:Arginase 1, mitochondrial, partial [Cucurbita argyrosperma subsp. sororia]